MLLVSGGIHAALCHGGYLELRFQSHPVIRACCQLVSELLQGRLQVGQGLQLHWGGPVQGLRDLAAVQRPVQLALLCEH